MNRTIKFRGKCSPQSKYKGEWVTGSLVIPEQIKDNEVLIVVAHSDNCKTTYHVNKDTVGQFTGLYDKNGKEIYEGDIVKYFKAEIYSDLLCYDPLFYQHEHRIKEYQSVVEYRYGCIMVENDYLYGAAFESIEQAMECLGIDECCEPCDCEGTEVNESIIGYEIIGNIHDNPELIKE